MASKLFEDIISEIEQQEKDPNYVKKVKTYSHDFYFGQMIGNIIVDNYLLNVNVDLMYNNVVLVSEEEFNKAKRLENYTYNHGYSDSSKEFRKDNHKVWLEYVDSLAAKYLPKTIDCIINLPLFTVTEDIQKGIENSIWNCDFSRYWVENLVGQTFGINNPITIYLK